MTILDKLRLDNKTALVTGGNRGLGLGIAVGLAEAGADIVNVSRSEAGELQAAVEGMGRRFLHISADLGAMDENSAETLLTTANSFTGNIDILVNNAGVNRRGPAADYAASDWHSVLNLNLNAIFHLTQAVARQMRANGGGKIINTASMLSFQGGMNSSAYAASKHAVAGLTKSLANEWASHNINVNAIAPGYFTTDLTAPLHTDDSANEAIRARIPAGYWGEAADLQGIAVLMASDAGSYMHGSIVAVDGGWLSR